MHRNYLSAHVISLNSVIVDTNTSMIAVKKHVVMKTMAYRGNPTMAKIAAFDATGESLACSAKALKRRLVQPSNICGFAGTPLRNTHYFGVSS